MRAQNNDKTSTKLSKDFIISNFETRRRETMSKTSHRNRNRRRSKTKDDDQLQQQQQNRASNHQCGTINNKSHPMAKQIGKTTKQKIGMVVGYTKIILSITLLCFLIFTTTTRKTTETKLNKTTENIKDENNTKISTPQPLSSSSSSSDDDAKITRFLSWITSHGGYISPSVTVKTFSSFGGGRGLLALSPIKHLDTLYSLPTALILTASKIAERHSHLIDDDNDKINFMDNFHKKTRGAFPPSTMKDQDAILALELMRQCYLGDDSEMKSYLDVFPPDDVNRLDSWSSWEREMVQDDHLKSYGDESSKRIEWSWREGNVESFARRMTGVDDDDDDDESGCLTLSSFRRFLSLVSSRAMVLDGVKYLTPLADMANYAPRGDGRLKGMGGDYFKLYHEIGKRQLSTGEGDEMMITVRADRDVEAGEQIFEDYGDTDNTLFLEAHGFVPDENPWHCAIVNFDHLSSSSSWEDKFAILDRLGLAQIQKTPNGSSGTTTLSMARHPDVCVKRDGTLIDNPSNNNAGDFLAVLGMDPDALHACHAILVDGKQYPKVPSEWVTKKCLLYDGREKSEMMALRDAALETQRRYVTSLEDDLKLLERAEDGDENNTTGGALLALKFRISEKSEMSLAIASLGDRIDDDGTVDVKTMTIEEDDDRSLQTCLDDDGVCSSNDENMDQRKDFNIDEYESFLDGLGISIRNIKPAYVGEGMRLGAVATKDMSIEDIYFSIPPNSTMSIDTARSSNDVLSELIQSNVFETIQDTTTTTNDDDFFPLLTYLLHERFQKSQKSQWWPYLTLLPSHTEMKHSLPIALSDHEINTILIGSDIRTDVLSYKRNVERRYHALRANYHLRKALTDEVLTMENVLWAHVVLDTRSIWWSGRRHLVPMLDLVNAAATLTRDDGSSFVPRVHRTDVETTANGSVQVVTRLSHATKAGEQVFENYGQPNYILFLYHGFILDENPNDCVLVNSLSFDPRIRWGRRHPTLCVRDDSHSLRQLGRVLRDERTNGNRSDDDDGSRDEVGLSDDVKDDVRAFLEGRLMMHDDLEEMDNNCRQQQVVVADGVGKIAQQIKRNERVILKRMLERFLKEWYPKE